MSRAWLVAFVWLTCAGIANAQSNAWLELPAGLNHNLVLESNGELTARIPAMYAANATVSEGGLKARVFDVVYKEGRSKGLASQFSIYVAKPTASTALAIVVSAGQPDKLPPGNYTLVAQVDAEFDSKNPKPQNIAFTLQRYAPQLAASSSVVIGQVRALFGGEVATASLRLSEQSGRAGASGLAFLEVRDPIPAASMPDSGKLKLPDSPVSVPANGISQIDVGVTGEFPLGKSAGKIEIRSPDLNAPLLVNYEVRVRRELWLIAVFAGLGAALGWVVRVWMGRRQALIAAHVTASDAIALIRKELDASEDASYQKVLNDWNAALTRALESKDAAKITEETKKAVDDVTAKRTKLQERLAEFERKAEEIRSVLDTPWGLPDEVSPALSAAQRDMADLQGRKAKRDAGGIELALNHLSGISLVTLFNDAGTQGVNLGRFLGALVDDGPPVADGVKAQIKQLADTAAAQFPSTLAPVKTTTVDDLRAMLQKVDGLLARTIALAESLESLTNRFIAGALSELQLEGTDEDAKVARLRDAAVALASSIAAEVRSPNTALLSLKGRAETLKRQWLAAFDARVTKKKSELVKAVKEGRWSDAVAIAREEIAPKETQLGGAESAPRAQLPQQAAIDFGPTRALTPTPSAPLEAMPPLRGTTQERQELFSQSRAIALAQTVILAALFTVGVYLLYADTWVGTGKELLTLLVLGFGVDLTGDSVVALFKKLKLPEL